MIQSADLLRLVELAPPTAELVDRILRVRAELPTQATYGRAGAWRSPSTVSGWPEAASVIEAIAAAARESGLGVARCRRLVAWAIVSPVGAYHAPHRHGSGFWSGVYYADAGGGQAATIFDGGSRVAPVVGRLALFPSSLLHWSEPHDGTRPRITIAVDFRLR